MLESIHNFFKKIFKIVNEIKLSNSYKDNLVLKRKPFSYNKKNIMTEYEKKFYFMFEKILTEEYVVFPQINLATIIDKKGNYKYQNELYRNIDFGVFTKDTLELILLIEINDKTHHSTNRRIRDYKVEDICNEAGYEIMKFWTNKPNDFSYVKKRILDYLDKHKTKEQSTEQNTLTEKYTNDPLILKANLYFRDILLDFNSKAILIAYFITFYSIISSFGSDQPIINMIISTLISLFIFLLIFFYRKLKTNNIIYNFYNDKLIVEVGTFNKSEKVVKYSNIIEIYKHQRFLDRINDVGNMEFITSSTNYNNGVTIWGIDNFKENSSEIYDLINCTKVSD